MGKINTKHILGIETSCDETAVALLRVKNKTNVKFLAELVYSQIKEHEKFGGVVPEVAARKHLEILPFMLKKVRDKTKLDFKKLDAIAVTYGPGLVTSLMVGVDTAKAVGMIYDIPVIPVNHLEGHILSSELPERGSTVQKILFPALALVVSGGHTELVLVESHLQFTRIGATLDDAAGEAFDKVAKLLGLGYPGGPLIEREAKNGNKEAYELPIPMVKHKSLNFSYSGLKNAVRLSLPKKITKKVVADISAAFQAAVTESLMVKLEKAIELYAPKTILFGGGVAGNGTIRRAFLRVGKKKKVSVRICPRKYAGDNASMIAWSAYYNLKNALPVKKLHTIDADPQLTYDSKKE